MGIKAGIDERRRFREAPSQKINRTEYLAEARETEEIRWLLIMFNEFWSFFLAIDLA